MKINKLPRAYELLQEIENIEEEIDGLDEMAKIVADKISTISVVFDVREHTDSTEPSPKQSVEMVGVLGPDGLMRLYPKNQNDMYGVPEDKQSEEDDIHEGIYGWEVDGADTLSIIAILYRSRMNNKRKLENRLKRMGVEL